MSGCLGGDSGGGSVGDVDPSNWPDLDGQEVHVLTQASSNPYQAYWSDLAAKFRQATNAEVQLEYVGLGTGLRERIAQLLQAGSPPEIAHIGMNEVATYGHAGQLADHSEVVNHWQDRWGEIPDHMQVQFDDQDQWLPMFANIWTNWYRADVFEEEPNTWETELRMAREHDEGQEGTRGTQLVLQDGAFSTGVHPLNYAWGNGASFCERVDGEVQVVMAEGENLDRWIEAMEHELDLYQYSGPGLDVSDDNMDAMVGQELTFQMRSSGTRPKVQATGMPVGSDVAPTHFPTNGTEQYWGNVQGHAVFEGADTEAGMEFLKFWAEPQHLLEGGEVTGGYFFPTPLHNGPIIDEIWEHETFEAALDELPDDWQLPRDLNREYISNGIDIANETDPVNPYAGTLKSSLELGGLKRDVLVNDIDPEEAIRNRAANLQEVIDDEN